MKVRERIPPSLQDDPQRVGTCAATAGRTSASGVGYKQLFRLLLNAGCRSDEQEDIASRVRELVATVVVIIATVVVALIHTELLRAVAMVVRLLPPPLARRYTTVGNTAAAYFEPLCIREQSAHREHCFQLVVVR